MADQYFKQSPSQLSEFLDFAEEDIENVQRVVKEVKKNNVEAEFIVHPKAKTVEQSANNTGVDKSQIVKTLVFKTGEKFVAVLCPGDERVSEEKLEDITGKEIRMANPDEVKENTGYVVGGVSPFDLDIPVYIEESILEQKKVKPAAGSRVVGIEIDSETLADVIEAKIITVT